jgi:hypothetical protein
LFNGGEVSIGREEGRKEGKERDVSCWLASGWLVSKQLDSVRNCLVKDHLSYFSSRGEVSESIILFFCTVLGVA